MYCWNSGSSIRASTSFMTSGSAWSFISSCMALGLLTARAGREGGRERKVSVFFINASLYDARSSQRQHGREGVRVRGAGGGGGGRRLLLCQRSKEGLEARQAQMILLRRAVHDPTHIYIYTPHTLALSGFPSLVLHPLTSHQARSCGKASVISTYKALGRPQAPCLRSVCP